MASDRGATQSTTGHPRLPLENKMGPANRAAFLGSVLEDSTECSLVAKDLEGRILARNEGARRVYGFEPADVLGQSAFLLHEPEGVTTGKAHQILTESHEVGKWPGALTRERKNRTKFRPFVSGPQFNS
jgi:PAS domain-containing protein